MPPGHASRRCRPACAGASKCPAAPASAPCIVDQRQKGGVIVQGLGHQTKPGKMAPPRKTPVLVHQIDRDRRAGVDDDSRRPAGRRPSWPRPRSSSRSMPTWSGSFNVHAQRQLRGTIQMTRTCRPGRAASRTSASRRLR